MNIKHVLKTTFISFLALLATLQTNAQDSLYTKFNRKINDAHRFKNPDWVRDISEAASIAMEIAKTQNRYREIVEVGNFLLEVKDYKNALTFLEFAAINKEKHAWNEVVRDYFQVSDIPNDIKERHKIFEKLFEYCQLQPEGKLLEQIDWFDNRQAVPPVERIRVYEQIEGFFRFPIPYRIHTMNSSQDILKNFEDCGYTFNAKESKEYLFKNDVKGDYGLYTYLPIILTKEQLEKSKDRPYLIPEAYIVRLFSDYKEDGSDIVQLVDLAIIKKKLKVLSREITEFNDGKAGLGFKTKENEEWESEYYYEYLGKFSNGVQLISCYQEGGSNPASRIVAFQAKKTDNSETEIEIVNVLVPADKPYIPYYYMEDDTLIFVDHNFSLDFYTCLSEDEFRKTKLDDMLKKIEEERKNAKMKRKRITPSMLRAIPNTE